MRQGDGGRVVDWDGVAPGGKRNVPFGVVIDQERAKKLGGQNHLSKRSVLSWKLVEVEDAFQAFEGHLDLPAKAIEFEGLLDGQLLGRGRGQQDHVFAGFQGPQVDRAFLVALLLFESATLFGSRLRLTDDEQPN